MSLAVNHSLREAEVAFLERLRSEYEDEGYTFAIHPSQSDLPAFLASYTPDAVARRPNHNVAIELKSRVTPANELSLSKIRKLFEGRPDWRLRIVYMGGDAADTWRLPVATRDSVMERAKEVERLVAAGNLRAAFVLAWSLLEAALNSVRPQADKRPRKPGTIVQTLAMDGLIPNELERSLRSLIDLRNRIVHGDLTAEPDKAAVHTVLTAVKSALAE